MRYSEKEKFNNCPLAYRLSFIDRLEKVEEGSSANDKVWGQGIHRGLELHYNGKSIDNVLQGFSAIYATNLDTDNLAKTKESGLECLRQYIAYYNTIDKNWKVLATEVLGKIEFAGEEHDLHIDLIAENLQGGGIYFFDHKTSGKKATTFYWKSYELSGQLSRYTQYVVEKYGQCSGSIINNIVAGHRKRMYKGEPAGNHYSFERQIFNRTKEQLAYWRESECDWNTLIKYCIEKNLFPKSLGKLCSWCDYYELCLANQDEQIKGLLYKVKEANNV